MSAVSAGKCDFPHRRDATVSSEARRTNELRPITARRTDAAGTVRRRENNTVRGTRNGRFGLMRRLRLCSVFRGRVTTRRWSFSHSAAARAERINRQTPPPRNSGIPWRGVWPEVWFSVGRGSLSARYKRRCSGDARVPLRRRTTRDTCGGSLDRARGGVVGATGIHD